MADKTVITQEELKALLSYDPETGIFTRKVARNNRQVVGQIAGTESSRGYWVIGINGKVYKAHRLAWLYVNGKWPSSELDHINRVKTDNRIANLRLATRSENTMNRAKARVDNKLGILGVSRVGSRFIARIAVGGKDKYLGIYKTPQEAGQAYIAARQELP